MPDTKNTQDPLAEQIERLDATRLLPIVAQVLQAEPATVTRWESRRLSRGATAAGVWRIRGQAEVQGQTQPWSVVAKLLRSQAPNYDGYFAPTQEPTNVTYWRREFDFYQAHMLDDLPIPFCAPRCYLAEQQDEVLICWLEDLGAVEATTWTDDQFALAARHLGMFNGIWLTDRALPDRPWLCKGLVRWRYEKQIPARQEYLDSMAQFVARFGDDTIWPEDVIAASWQLLEDCPDFLKALEKLPKTFMHQDAGRKSLLQRTTAGGQIETVALDWDFCGLGELGAEIASLVTVSARWFGLEPERLERVERAVLEGYLDGLQQVGWRGNADQVRLAYLLATAIMFRFILNGDMATNPERYRAPMEAMFGRNMEEVIHRWGRVNHFVLQKAQQARDMLGMGRAWEVGVA